MMDRIVAHPLAPLSLFAAILTALLTTYLVIGIAPSATFEILAAFSWSMLLAFWIVADARRRSGIPCFDFGFYCYLFLPIAVPWYCFWSRGWRGAITLAGIASLWLAPYIVATIVWLAMSA